MMIVRPLRFAISYPSDSNAINVLVERKLVNAY